MTALPCCAVPASAREYVWCLVWCETQWQRSTTARDQGIERNRAMCERSNPSGGDEIAESQDARVVPWSAVAYPRGVRTRGRGSACGCGKWARM